MREREYAPTEALALTPVSLREANAFIARVHRHHAPVRGMKFAVAVWDASEMRAVAVASRPVSRVLQAQDYLEVTRVASDGARNACSMLYGAMRRAGTALGYDARRIITYTLATEDGASLRAAGWVVDAATTGGSWDTPSRRRTDNAPTGPKTRWRAAA